MIRRSFITLSTALITLIPKVSFSNELQVTNSTKEFTRELTILNNITDILIPKDELPSASEVNVAESIFHELQQDKKQYDNLKARLIHFDITAKQIFSDTTIKNHQQQFLLIDKIFRLKDSSTHYSLISYINQLAAKHYYSSPQITQNFLGQNSPQPKGYLDHDKNPIDLSNKLTGSSSL